MIIHPQRSLNFHTDTGVPFDFEVTCDDHTAELTLRDGDGSWSFNLVDESVLASMVQLSELIGYVVEVSRYRSQEQKNREARAQNAQARRGVSYPLIPSGIPGVEIEAIG